MNNIRRNTQAFINNISPITQSHDELVKENLEIGKFPLTKTAIIKLVSMIILLAGFSLFVSQSVCQRTADWYPYLYPISIGLSVVIQLIFFLIFSFGCTVNNPGLWVTLDIVCNFLSAVNSIIVSFLTNFECSGDSQTQHIPGPMGIAGGVILIVGCCAMFLLYRYREEDENEEQIDQKDKTSQELARKSVFA